MTEKSSNRTSIALSIATYDKLHTLKITIEKIVRKKLDYDQIVNILLSTKPLEDQLADMLVETEAIEAAKR